MTSLPTNLVLYAEDDENDVFFMERAFSKLKLRGALRVVQNGRAAVDYLSGTRAYVDRAKYPLPNLLLLDVKMPEMSGLEVLKWARERPAFQPLPILLFTSSTQRSDIEFSRAHEASGYLVKPSNSDHLAVLVSKILAASAVLLSKGEILKLEENLLGTAL
ncbi:MAG: response regulator [Opitutaceae bacterium]